LTEADSRAEFENARAFQEKLTPFREKQGKTGDVGDQIIYFGLGKVGVHGDVQRESRCGPKFQQFQTDSGQVMGDGLVRRVGELFKTSQRIGFDPPAKTLARLFQPRQQTGLGNLLKFEVPAIGVPVCRLIFATNEPFYFQSPLPLWPHT
jgi:hypothetical protein